MGAAGGAEVAKRKYSDYGSVVFRNTFQPSTR
jgi:hypothetical protein